MLGDPACFARSVRTTRRMLGDPAGFIRSAYRTRRMLGDPARSVAFFATSSAITPGGHSAYNVEDVGRSCAFRRLLHHLYVQRHHARRPQRLQRGGCLNIPPVLLGRRAQRGGCWEIQRVSFARRTERGGCWEIQRVPSPALPSPRPAPSHRGRQRLQRRGCWNMQRVSLRRRAQRGGCWEIQRVSFARRTERGGCWEIRRVPSPPLPSPRPAPSQPGAIVLTTPRMFEDPARFAR